MEYRMFRVLRNFLTDEDLKELKRASAECLHTSRYIQKDRLTPVQKKLVKLSEEYVGDIDLLGVEQWAFHNFYTNLPFLHQDKDERLYEVEQELSFPACSCVLYLQIEDLEGGNLKIGEEEIVPETGTVVLLKPEVWHEITPCTGGTRHSINYNLWDKPLYSS